MSREQEGPRNKETSTGSAVPTTPDVTPRREGGDDALAEANPSDNRMDEKVIVNEQSSQKVVNAPSQTDVHAAESEATVDDI